MVQHSYKDSVSLLEALSGIFLLSVFCASYRYLELVDVTSRTMSPRHLFHLLDRSEEAHPFEFMLLRVKRRGVLKISENKEDDEVQSRMNLDHIIILE